MKVFVSQMMEPFKTNEVRTSNPTCIIIILSRVSQWLVIEFINNLHVLTTINYCTIADFHTTKTLHANLFSLSALVFIDL
jgi:hypothetical protein